MPLADRLLIACKDQVIELTATLEAAHLDPPEALDAAVAERLVAHRHLVMTDPMVLEDDLGVASVVLSRDPLPAWVGARLTAHGLVQEKTEEGGRASEGWLGRVGRDRKSRLERWRLAYARAADHGPALSAFETELIDRAPDAPLHPSDLADAAEAVRAAAAVAYGLDAPPTAEGIAALETALRVDAADRLVLHPAAVRCLVGAVVVAVLDRYPGAEWQQGGEPPLLVPAGAERVGSDPEFRVVERIRRGPRASLAAYVLGLGG